MIDSYFNMWERRRSHILTPLTKLTGDTSKAINSIKKKIPWKWEKEHQEAFNAAKRI